jgi:hypothetical protein
MLHLIGSAADRIDLRATVHRPSVGSPRSIAATLGEFPPKEEPRVPSVLCRGVGLGGNRRPGHHERVHR